VGLVPGRLFVAVDVFAECAGGLLLVAGLFEPAAAAVSLALTGPGGYSLNAILGLRSCWTPLTTSITIAAGAAGGFASLGMRRPRLRDRSSGAVA